jgi:uncharacterized protein YjbI with pentapeptide repeats
METEKLLTILRNGSDAWNRWRTDNPLQYPDFRGASLHEINLDGANLSNANMSGANLYKASLGGADLGGTNLSGANLCNSNLREANLKEANLSEANLYEATLGKSNLSGANLSGADLRKSDLSMVESWGAGLSGANLGNAVLIGAKLSWADLRGADLSGANLSRAKISWANLGGTDFCGANLSRTNLSGSNLRQANLREADFSEANLTGVNLDGSNLSHTVLVQSNLKNAKLNNCRIYGISAWDIKSNKSTQQQDLIITPDGRPEITVDNLEIAQFVYLLVHNEKIRSVVDTIGQKVVLVTGYFGEKRKTVLDAVRNKLRKLGFVPMSFDFESATQKDFTETVKVLSGMSRFIIADITSQKSSLLKLPADVPDNMIPLVPIYDRNEEPSPMFRDFKNSSERVLEVVEYDSAAGLIKALEDAVVKPALKKAEQMELKKAEAMAC